MKEIDQVIKDRCQRLHLQNKFSYKITCLVTTSGIILGIFLILYGYFNGKNSTAYLGLFYLLTGILFRLLANKIKYFRTKEIHAIIEKLKK